MNDVTIINNKSTSQREDWISLQFNNQQCLHGLSFIDINAILGIFNFQRCQWCRSMITLYFVLLQTVYTSLTIRNKRWQAEQFIMLNIILLKNIINAQYYTFCSNQNLHKSKALEALLLNTPKVSLRNGVLAHRSWTLGVAEGPNFKLL